MTSPDSWTIAEIEAFQADPLHRDPLGKRLAVDGVLGPRTRWAIAVDTLASQRVAFLDAFNEWHGLVETAPNEDPRGIIRGLLARCPGAKPGDPWCAALQSAALSRALPRPVAIAGALRLLDAFPPVEEPMAGDIGGYPTNDAGAGHVFAVAGRSGNLLMTFEGNCANAFRVALRFRTPAMRFSRPIADATGDHPGVIDVPFAGSRTR